MVVPTGRNPIHRGAGQGAAVSELVSVIVATYNREDALDAVLRGLACQTDRHFEVIVADDGSGPSTAAVVKGWSSRLDVPVVHAWHEDKGFRLAEIRNRAIRQSSGRTCIFLDGDCVPRPNFVAAHRHLSERGCFVAGNRILLSAGMTERILRDHLEPELWGPSVWIGARLRGHVNRLIPLLSLPLGPLRHMQGRTWRGARGSNLAIGREDLEWVDGFDSAFTGWGREDSDIMVRLIRSGIRRKDGRFATGVLHLWHPEHDRSQLSENQAKLDLLLHSDRVQARHGLSALR